MATTDWHGYIEAYLSPRHVRDRANGCPYAALSGDVPRESEPIKAAFSQALESNIATVAGKMESRSGATARDRAILSLATMVGALVLARTAGTADLRDEILAAVKNKLLGASRT
jgi:TetR/AcrR family transcriptional repressor of nem operon